MGNKRKTAFIVGIEFDFSREPRIIQEIYALRDRYHLVGVGRGTHPDMDEFLDIRHDLSVVDVVLDKLLPYLKYFFPGLLLFRHRKALRLIDEIQPDYLSAHHLESAILACEKTDNMIFNSHEFIPKQHDGMLLWKCTKGVMVKSTMPKVLRSVTFMHVEGEAAKEAYQEYYKSIPEVVVIPNATKARPELKPIQVNSEHIKIVHHGIATIGRGLKTFVDLAKILESGYSLHFYLVQSATFPRFYDQLLEYAKDVPNVFFHNPVTYDYIVPTVNGYDIGLCVFNSKNFHTRFTTVPNKFWEYVAGRVIPVVCEESGMSRICRKHDFGIIVENPTAECIARAIRNKTVCGLMQDKRRLDEIHNEFTAERTIYPIIQDCAEKTMSKN